MLRTHHAGVLRASDAGTTVTLAGWVARRRDHGGVAFIDLRDSTGVVQVVVRDEKTAHILRSEFCVKVVGEISKRPSGNENPELPTVLLLQFALKQTCLCLVDDELWRSCFLHRYRIHQGSDSLIH